MRIEGLVSDLLSQLESGVSPGDRAALLRVLQQWLKTHLAAWNAQLRERWALDALATLDLPRYPIDESSLDPDEELRRLKLAPPTTMELLAMRVRDILWEGVTIESSVVCPRCGERQLRILEHASSDSIVLSCDLCAWSQTPQGEPWKHAGLLQPISQGRIAKEGLLVANE